MGLATTGYLIRLQTVTASSQYTVPADNPPMIYLKKICRLYTSFSLLRNYPALLNKSGENISVCLKKNTKTMM